MKADDLNLKPQYRMPRVFGALPGPRNVPKDKQNLPDNQTELVIAVTGSPTGSFWRNCSHLIARSTVSR